MNIVKVRFRSSDEFDANYQPELAGGGLFCPTTTPLTEGDEVVIELSVPALPNKVLIRGTVLSWRPALPRLRVRAGAVVEFLPQEEHKRAFVLGTLDGSRGPSARRRHMRLPVEIDCRYRAREQKLYIETKVIEISVGGAMLATEEPVPIGANLVIEMTLPGAARPMAISAKVAYHSDTGWTGVKFVYRDSGGSRRLQELIRRLREE